MYVNMILWVIESIAGHSFDAAESGPPPWHSVRCPDHFCQKTFPQELKVTRLKRHLKFYPRRQTRHLICCVLLVPGYLVWFQNIWCQPIRTTHDLYKPMRIHQNLIIAFSQSVSDRIYINQWESVTIWKFSRRSPLGADSSGLLFSDFSNII